MTFHNAQTGADLFDRPMRGRWASLPQPEVVFQSNGTRVLLPDPSLTASIPEIDIPWGEQEPLDIAIRFENDRIAYGWSNENYYDPLRRYRADNWRITDERCLVKVVVRGSGEKCTETFGFRNAVDAELKLVPATRAEKALLE